MFRNGHYLPPFERNEIAKLYLQRHATTPLFTNAVGSWANRPEARTHIPNLYLAGDYCRSHIDLVCMEGAIVTGLHAAQALCEDLKLDSEVPVLEPKIYPRWLLVVSRMALAPVAALARMVAAIRGPDHTGSPLRPLS